MRVKNISWAIYQLFRAAPWETFVLSFFVIFQGLIPAASLYALQGIVNWVSTNAEFPVYFMVLWGGMLFADVAVAPLVTVIRLNINEKILAHCNLLLMEKANTIEGLAPFENPVFYDEIQLLKNESARRPLNFVYIITGVAKDAVALASILMILGGLAWWIPLGILAASLPHALSSLWFEKQAWDQMLFRAPETRRMAWLSSLMVDDRVAKEMRLFDFGQVIIERYKQLVQVLHQKLVGERWKKTFFAILVSTTTVVGNLVIILYVLLQTKSGFFPISALVISIQALIMTQLQLCSCIANMGMMAPSLLFFDKFRKFLDHFVCSISQNASVNEPVFNTEITLRDVSFFYPDGRQALSGVNLTIRKGERLAIVGENGAGKSTMVKLLLRFYDPTEGVITVDGQDLKTLNLKAWRQLISGVFQDFGQYHFTVSENISLGCHMASQEQVFQAATQGGFTPVLDKLARGMHEPLGKEFGGTSLSGGEWQRLAMSRSFVRDSSFLILDEPTAALDPESEQRVFQQYSTQIQGKTALLITHRLGSVKLADRILVFKQGRLVEQGSHAELLKQKGEYAYLYSLQAQQYHSV